MEMGTNKDVAVGFGVLAVIIVIIVGVVLAVINTGETKTENDAKEIAKDVLDKGTGETKSVEQNKPIETQKELSYIDRFMEKENKVLDLAKDYKGKDNSGLTMAEVIAMSILIEYPGEDILKNPSTELGWSALPISGDPDTDKSWDVKFYLNTYKESVSYEWTVDMETNSMYAKNVNGKVILDMLND